jgi:hypothetical protein
MVPQCDFFSFFTEKEKAYLETHIQEFSTLQMENLERTIKLQDTPSSEFDWKEQFANAQTWCKEFRVPSRVLKK